MSNQFIGVSPPPIQGQALDSKVDLKKDFNETSRGQYKNDFEKALKEKLATKEKDKEKAQAEQKKSASFETDPPQKEARVKKDDKESKVDPEKEKSSGGTKKKMTKKVDDQMVSMLMASQESEVETPESKNDLAAIEENQPKEIMGIAAQPIQVGAKSVIPKEEAIAKTGKEVSVTAEAGLSMDALSPEMLQKIQDKLAQMKEQGNPQKVSSEPKELKAPAPESVTPNLGLPEHELTEAEATAIPNVKVESEVSGPVKELMQKLKALQADQVDVAGAPALDPKVVADAMQAAPLAMMVAAPVAIAVATNAMGTAAPKEFNLEQELGAEVGFEPGVDDSKKSPSLDSSEAKPVSLKTQEFQKSVYDQLQRTETRPPTAALQSNEKRPQEKEAKLDDLTQQPAMKMDPMNPNEMQHAGQTDFKAHLGAPIVVGSDQHRAQLLEQNHEKNVQEVMNQAQYLVKQGGGEMKVSMSPDGLAEVQLKVMVQDGKVNIEMHTQDKAVKRLMEDSLTELKSGLAAQHLSVEHVKINSTVTGTNTDNSAQFQSNWNHNGSDSQKRDYWNQFQENLNQNNSRRSNYASGLQGSTRTAAAGAPTDGVTAAGTSPRTYGGTKGSQINWVA